MTIDLRIDTDQVLLLLRVILGATLLYYGFPKIKDLGANARDFVGMGFKPGMVWGTLVAVTEFVGGAVIVLGLGAELAAAAFGFQMLVGSFWKHKQGKGFDEYFYDIQLFALCLTLMHFGAGAYSLLSLRPAFALRWDVAVGSLILAFVLAHLPEILGDRYQRWGVESR